MRQFQGSPVRHVSRCGTHFFFFFNKMGKKKEFYVSGLLLIKKKNPSPLPFYSTKSFFPLFRRHQELWRLDSSYTPFLREITKHGDAFSPTSWHLWSSPPIFLCVSTLL